MSELLAAIPSMFRRHRPNEYERIVQRARSDQLVNRSMASTHRQMMKAYASVVIDAEKANHPGKKID